MERRCIMDTVDAHHASCQGLNAKKNALTHLHNFSFPAALVVFLGCHGMRLLLITKRDVW
jgi:hypothetical protein